MWTAFKRFAVGAVVGEHVFFRIDEARGNPAFRSLDKYLYRTLRDLDEFDNPEDRGEPRGARHDVASMGAWLEDTMASDAYVPLWGYVYLPASEIVQRNREHQACWAIRHMPVYMSIHMCIHMALPMSTYMHRDMSILICIHICLYASLPGAFGCADHEAAVESIPCVEC